MAGWSDFFAAEAGASAALAGLVIVAISINLARIIAFPRLPGRAAETLVTPTGVLVVSSVMLVPGQPQAALAAEIGMAGAVMWLMPMVIQLRTWRSEVALPRRSLMVRFALTQVSSLPVLIAAALLLHGDPYAVAWLVPGIIASLIATVINSWVLLVEILR